MKDEDDKVTRRRGDKVMRVLGYISALLAGLIGVAFCVGALWLTVESKGRFDLGAALCLVAAYFAAEAALTIHRCARRL